MKRLTILIATLSCLAASGPLAAGEVVLVASSRSPLGQLTASEARKLFLGMPLRVSGQAANPIRNISDARINEAFMQRVMFMSSEEYERQIKTRISRNGGASPLAYERLPDLVAALQRDLLAITYMAESEAKRGSGLKIIGEP